MTVKWNGGPPEDKIRAALSKKISGEVTVQPFTDVGSRDEIAIGTERMGEQQMNAARKAMQDTLEATYGIDFKQGTQMTVKWNGAPPEDKIRAALSKKISGEVTVQPFTDVGSRDEIAIGTERNLV